MYGLDMMALTEKQQNKKSYGSEEKNGGIESGGWREGKF